MSQKIIAIAVPLEENLLSPLHHWGTRFDWSHIEEIHFIHIVKKVVMPIEFSVAENPTPEVFEKMKPTLKNHLMDEGKKILHPEFKGKVVYHVDCDFSPEDSMIEKIKQIKASLLVVSTHGRKGFNGLFHSSFTEHMIKFAPCDVYVVRPEKK